eukprot:TRINITY_DN186_c0_g1_i1.p1 TRINITY_DN186_c0_g1~~TRINITY_DN186_c0_g1_i1.p1  ORF type:complete len:588 (+),score=143.93 TRINITY_DN186_c0_g1_i1:252-2015(+)
MDLSQCLLVAALKGNADSMAQLLKEGANVHVKDNTTTITPLHIAAFHGHAECVKLLLENGADVHSTYNYGETPLHLACREGNADVAKVLLSYGATTRVTDKWGNTPLHICIRNNKPACAIAILKAEPDAVNLRDGDGDTPLHDAVRCDLPTCVQLLLMHNADSTLTNNRGQNPLALSKSKEVTHILESTKIQKNRKEKKEKKEHALQEEKKEKAKFNYSLKSVFEDGSSPNNSSSRCSSIVAEEGEVKFKDRQAIVIECKDTEEEKASAKHDKRKKVQKKVKHSIPDDKEEDYEDLKKFLQDLGLSKYFPVFRQQEIKYETIPLLTETDLEELNLPIGPRRQIMCFIRQNHPSVLPALVTGEELRFRKEGEGNRILGVYDTFDRDGKNVSVKKYLYSVEDLIQYFQDLCALRPELLKTDSIQSANRKGNENRTILQLFALLGETHLMANGDRSNEHDPSERASVEKPTDIYTESEASEMFMMGGRRRSVGEGTEEDRSLYEDPFDPNFDSTKPPNSMINPPHYRARPKGSVEVNQMMIGGDSVYIDSWHSNTFTDGMRPPPSIFSGLPSMKEQPEYTPQQKHSCILS